MDPQLAAFVANYSESAAGNIALESEQLRGGLVSPSVRRVIARYSDHNGGRRQLRFVVKQLEGSTLRELDVYQALAQQPREFAPDLLHAVHNDESAIMYLDSIDSKPVWPWRDLSLATRVLEKLASLHCLGLTLDTSMAWDYEAELELAARETLSTALEAAHTTKDPILRACLPALRRLVADIRGVRGRLLDYEPLPCTMIHGDVHPGNVLMRRRRAVSEPLLVDWARARLGSPLEDVSSWIQWLAFWEFGAMRRHDTLFGTYLRVRGLATPPSRDLRDAYWAAGAVNCCSGALNYHLGRAVDRTLGERQRDNSLRAAHHCLRIIRRAALGQFCH